MAAFKYSRPELVTLGFDGLRRRELLDLLKRYEPKIGKVEENQGKDKLVKMAEGWFAQGMLGPDPLGIKAEEQGFSGAVAQEVEALRAKDREREAEVAALKAQMAALLELVEPPKTPKSIDDMDIGELRTLAKERGVNSFGLSADKIRDALREAG